MAKVEMNSYPASVIHVVNDFNNGLSPAECQQSIQNVFEDHAIPVAERNPIISVSDVRPFNITDGAFTLLQLSNNRRRRQSIFVGVVDPGVGTQRRGIVVTTQEKHTFIGPDNGLFGPALAQQEITGAYKIKDGTFHQSSPTFHGRDQFAPLAGEIASGLLPTEIPHLERIAPEGLVNKTFQEGEIVHLDGYANIKLGKKGLPYDLAGNRAEQVTLWTAKKAWEKGSAARCIKAPVVDTFEDVRIGEWLVYEGSSGRDGDSGYVEVAIRDRAGKRGAGGRLAIEVGDVVNLAWQFPKKR